MNIPFNNIIPLKFFGIVKPSKADFKVSNALYTNNLIF
jgi:hypothetical protein